MLMDVLGAVIGYIAVILLLSLLVTACVQFTQNWLRLRGNNLQHGLQILLSNSRTDKETDESGKNASLTMNMASMSVLESKKKTPGNMTKLLGPSTSWIEEKNLPNLLEKLNIKLSVDQKKEIVDSFKNMELYLNKRFAGIIRIVSITWALVIAIAFQVNTPDLLKELSVNSEIRTKYSAYADKALEEASEVIQSATQYQNISSQVLNELSDKYPEQAEKLEELSGIGEGKQELLTEMEMIFEEDPSIGKTIMKDYDVQLVAAYNHAVKNAKNDAQNIIGKLGYFNIDLWSKGNEYYYDDKIQYKNIFGVLITAILLTFGAPFWFEQLKNMVKLRDQLQFLSNSNKK